MSKTVQCTSPNAIPDAAHDGKPWKACLRFVGTNYENVSCHSSKFWEITGVGLGSVTVRWGRIGKKGRSQTVSYSVALDRLYKKYNDGYVFS